MELNELIQELVKLDRDTVVKALHEHAQPLYQAVFDRGHAVATEKWDAKLKAIDEEKKAAEKRADDAEKRAKELEDRAPDVAKLHADYKAEIERVKGEADRRVKALTESIMAERRARARADLKAAMIRLGLDGDYAEVKAEQMETRIRFGESGQLEVLKAGTEIPLQAADGKSPLDLLAKEVYDAADAKWKTSNADRGSGTGGGARGGSGLVTQEQIRERMRASGDYVI